MRDWLNGENHKNTLASFNPQYNLGLHKVSLSQYQHKYDKDQIDLWKYVMHSSLEKYIERLIFTKKSFYLCKVQKVFKHCSLQRQIEILQMTIQVSQLAALKKRDTVQSN